MSGFRKRSRIWLEYGNESLLGKGGYELLKGIKEYGSLKKSAESSGLSYKYAWDYIRKLEGVLGSRVVESFRGGREKGGMKLTQLGESLLREYERTSSLISRIIEEESELSSLGHFSARNRLKGRVRKVEKGDVCSRLEIEISIPARIVSLISTEALRELEIEEGDEVLAVIKATEILISKA